MGKYEVKAFPFYAKEHTWVRKMADGSYKIGISDYAQQQLGDVNYAELPEEGDTISKGESFGSIESAKTVSDLIAPISGTIEAVNEDVLDEPDLINRACYDGGWLLSVTPDDWEGETAELLSADAYKELLKSLED